MSHSSGLPDVADYGWHDPQLGDETLSEFARSMSGWRLQAEPGATYSYSNAGYELLGLLLSRVCGTTFEDAVRRLVLAPLGTRDSTFLRAEVPAHLAASPHVGMPLTVPDGAYPYTRRHAPSSTLHSNLVEMCRWLVAHLEPTRAGPRAARPEHRTLSHSGADPGFGSRLVLLPEQRVGVVVLANSNAVPTSNIAAAALDVALGEESGEAVWGAIELHRTDLVWPLLRVWTELRPDSSEARTMTDWARRVDGQLPPE